MIRHYDETALVNFQDLKNIIREEVGKLIEEVKGTAKQSEAPLSIQQLADRYGVSKATVHNWKAQGIIKGFKMGKGRFFHLAEVEKNLNQYRYLDKLESQGLKQIKRPF